MRGLRPLPEERDDGGTAARAGRALVAWALGLGLEHIYLGFTARDELAGAWELWPARTAGAPIFVGMGLAAAFVCVGLSWLVERDDRRPLEGLAAIAGLAVGWGVGTGRHFAHAVAGVPLLRVVLGLAVALVAVSTVKAYAALRTRAPRAEPWVMAGVAVIAWWVDGHVLLRLYPAFHVGLFAVSLVASAFAAIDARVPSPRVVAFAALAVGAACLAYIPAAAKRLHAYDNLRRVLVERAPWMGQAVRVATLIAPPPPILVKDLEGPGEVARALDWNGLDIVLVSIDALRADHVGAYGYGRPTTTPRIDGLAREGTRFVHAYCPTPHTSYSVTSMMTGKYMRPLLTLGLGQDSETLASDLRRYGYRTAAFYPPAVFFIDEAKFESFEQRALDFEYRKVEFADPALREAQLTGYLASAPADKPLFLWVHFFEPHEPYVEHPEHHFGDADIDAYDSEIATADDGVGRVVSAVRAVRPSAVIIVTADHGEEFGDHGGRYHGTTVYEEQVRVPLVVVGKGVRPGAAVEDPVQTIDVLPTILSALGIPRPPRVRGQDLGESLAHDAPARPGAARHFAFAETDGFSLLAKGPLRLVCDKQADACSLFDVTADPGEKHDLSTARPADVTAMRGELFAMERSHGRFEGQGASLPEALRRGSAGDVAAAEEVAGLLDDVNVSYRREAARVLFDLRSPKVTAQLARASAHDEDEEVRGLCTAALARVEGSDLAPARMALSSPTSDVRRRAALALAEHDDPTGASELVAWLTAGNAEFSQQREILAALGRVKARSAVAALVPLLDDVRLRGPTASALGAIGDRAARGPLLSHFESEPYVPVRETEARALLALGAAADLRVALTRYAGMPEPMHGAVELAMDAGLVPPSPSLESASGLVLRAPVKGPLRLGLLFAGKTPNVTVEVDGKPVSLAGDDLEKWADVPDHGDSVTVRASSQGGDLRGAWLVPRVHDSGTN
jgi:arylsulfatase A-like enzyme/HEAT repeat protein